LKYKQFNKCDLLLFFAYWLITNLFPFIKGCRIGRITFKKEKIYLKKEREN